MNQAGGFTIAELIITMLIIGILATLAVFIPRQVVPDARDLERSEDALSFARRLEQAYTSQDIETGRATYAPTTRVLFDIQTKSGIMARFNYDALRAPGVPQNEVSIRGATNTDSTDPEGPGSPQLNRYVYQPLTADGQLCQHPDATCIRFFLYYRLEKTNEVKMIKSIHQQ